MPTLNTPASKPTTASTNVPTSTTLNYFTVDSDDSCDAEIVSDFTHADDNYGDLSYSDMDISSDSSKISDSGQSLNLCLECVFICVSMCGWRVYTSIL